jgi:hypothetical protein
VSTADSILDGRHRTFWALKCDIPRASFARGRSDLQKCHKKTFVFSALLNVHKNIVEKQRVIRLPKY